MTPTAPWRPRQILAVGRNYAAHAAELGNDLPAAPLLFWKGVSSLAGPELGPGDGVCPLPAWADGPTRIDYEGEVALVLGRDIGPGTAPLPADPWEAVSGLCAAVDVSDRDLQQREPQWVRAKSFAGACALSQPGPRPADPGAVHLETWKGGERVQEGHASQLLFGFRDLLVYLHGFCRLFAGDAILTGTPAGVGPMAAGDRIEVRVFGGGQEAPLARVTLEVTAGPAVPGFVRRAAAPVPR